MRSSFYIPTSGTDDWRALIAEPDKQWRAGYSAHALATTWEAAEGFPRPVAQVFMDADAPALSGLQIVAGFPEHQTPLPGGSRPSQTDLLVLARNVQDELVCIAVEGKAEESFGPLVSEWLAEGTPGKARRLAYLCELLGLDPYSVDGLRYQLLHRTASAIIEARRFCAPTAVMLVHSFSPNANWFEDFEAFASAVDTPVARNSVAAVPGGPEGLWLGWVSDVAPD